VLGTLVRGKPSSAKLLANVVGNEVLTDILNKLAGRSSLITMLYQSTRDAMCSSEEHACVHYCGQGR